VATVLRIDDADVLLDLLNDLNENGHTPEISGLDRFGTPYMAWLNEVGGDEVHPFAARLEGEDSAVQRATEITIEDLRYPLVTFAVTEADEPVRVVRGESA
jgi:hypothetical protein